MTVERQSYGGRLTVSVVIPMRNEEEHIAQCLQSVIDQDYPKELMEVLVVDGMSEDDSRKIVVDFTRQFQFIRILLNRKQSTASALNRGIVESEGQVIIRMDAHCRFNGDYIRSCIEVMKETGAENVGGYVTPLGATYVQKAIALGMGCSFGIGTSRFGQSDKGRFVDTVSFGAYRRQVFEKVGLYDEKAYFGEDDELNYRLTKSGGRVFLSPRIKSEYYPRSSIPALWRQYCNYGFGKVRTMKKHGRPSGWRHLTPVIFLVSLVASLTLCLFNAVFAWLAVGICGSYLMASTLVSTTICLREGWRYLPVLPVVFATLHVSYGTGFLKGSLRGDLP